MGQSEGTTGWAMMMIGVSERMMEGIDPENMRDERCENCGAHFRRIKGKRMHYCPQCRVQRSVTYQNAIREKAGPAYENVVRGQLRHWLDEAERLGLSLDHWSLVRLDVETPRRLVS